MINNADLPVTPVVNNSGHPHFVKDIAFDGSLITGLTKREYFAARAMQGFIAAGNQGMPTATSVADLSVTYSDALLEALEKVNPVDLPSLPTNCRQRLIYEGKPYSKSSCEVCGQFSPRLVECNLALNIGD